MIYFIQDSGTCSIKIGYTAGSAGTRMAQLQTGNPSLLVLLKVIDGEQIDERNLHVRFAAHRSNGEWFRPAPSLLQFLIRLGEDWRPSPPVLAPASPAARATFPETEPDLTDPDDWPAFWPKLRYLIGEILATQLARAGRPYVGRLSVHFSFPVAYLREQEACERLESVNRIEQAMLNVTGQDWTVHITSEAAS